MGVCDICAVPGEGTLLAASQVREAVLDKGFDPFSKGLFPRATPPGYFDQWKNTVVANDVSDWSLCARCFAAIRPYFEGDPAPLDVREGAVPVAQRTAGPRYVPGEDPVVDEMLQPLLRAQQKPENEKKGGNDTAGFFIVVLCIGVSYGFHLLFDWDFWPSAGAGFAATLLTVGILEAVWKKLRRK